MNKIIISKQVAYFSHIYNIIQYHIQVQDPKFSGSRVVLV